MGKMKEGADDKGCCAEVPGDTVAAADASGQASRAFIALMQAVGDDGALDARVKEIVNFALVVMARCGPCVKAHLSKARRMGISQAELDEAAWCAVAIGGAPVRMFYQEVSGQ